MCGTYKSVPYSAKWHRHQYPHTETRRSLKNLQIEGAQIQEEQQTKKRGRRRKEEEKSKINLDAFSAGGGPGFFGWT